MPHPIGSSPKGLNVATSANEQRPTFALRLTQARLRAGLSQIELGRRAGLELSVASPRINQYEKGLHVPHHETAKRLAKVLGIPTAFLCAEDEQLAKLLLAWAEMSLAERKKLLKQVQAAQKAGKG